MGTKENLINFRKFLLEIRDQENLAKKINKLTTKKHNIEKVKIVIDELIGCCVAVEYFLEDNDNPGKRMLQNPKLCQLKIFLFYFIIASARLLKIINSNQTSTSIYIIEYRNKLIEHNDEFTFGPPGSSYETMHSGDSGITSYQLHHNVKVYNKNIKILLKKLIGRKGIKSKSYNFYYNIYEYNQNSKRWKISNNIDTSEFLIKICYGYLDEIKKFFEKKQPSCLCKNKHKKDHYFHTHFLPLLFEYNDTPPVTFELIINTIKELLK